MRQRQDTFQKIVQRDAPSSIAASSSSTRDAAHVGGHEEHAERRDQPGQDQAGIAVVQMQPGEQLVLRQDHRLARHREAEQHEDEQGAPEREVETRETVAGKAREDEHARGRAERRRSRC